MGPQHLKSTSSTRTNSPFVRLSNLSQHLRDGRDQLVRHLLDRTPKALFHFDVIYIAELADPIPLPRRDEELIIRELRTEDLAELHRAFPRKDRAQFGRRMAAGHKCLACDVGGAVCGMAWLNLGSIHEEPEEFCRFVIPQDAAWHYDIMILPECRRRGMFSSLMNHAFDFIRKEGRVRMCGFTSWHNKGSLKAHTSVGFRLTKKISAINLLGFRFHRIRMLSGDQSTQIKIGFLAKHSVEVN